jgi:peptidoglycan L-alanyl-D-glutamate endopeptidase CwlK
LGATSRESKRLSTTRSSQYGLDRPFGKYDYRGDLHNHAPGMGAKYKGRGFIQLTGRKNYVDYAARARAPEIVERPERAGDPDVAARILAAYVLQNSDRILRAIRAGDLTKARSVVNGSPPHGVVAFSKAFEAGHRLVFKAISAAPLEQSAQPRTLDRMP